jgi:RNA polymerase sigma-70 factor (ECF subfamily)
VIRRRTQPALVDLDQLETRVEGGDSERQADRNLAMARLTALIHELKTMDRQVMLLYLEGLDAAEIGEVTGLSGANVATKVHRIKKILTRRFHDGGRDGQ